MFQRKLDDIYRDIPNVTGIADDILVYGATQEEHDTALRRMLEATKENNVSLNSEKLQFRKTSVEFYGHTLTSEGIKPATEKLDTIKNLKTPSNSKELHTILGMITYLNRYSPKLAELTAPLRQLLKKEVHFRWEPHHDEALTKIKEELCSSKILSYYDPDPATPTILQCDASQLGVGAWIRQKGHNGEEEIVAMASRSLSPTESSTYSNLERECLAVMYGLEKFDFYLLGRQVVVETDHSPLEQIFKKKIDDAPARLQRMLLRCLKYDVVVKYKAGKSIPVADALSRVCFEMTVNTVECMPSFSCAPEYNIDFITDRTDIIDIDMIKEETAKDPTMNLLKDIIYRGWPSYRRECPQELWEFWNFRCDLVLEDGLVLKGDRTIIPAALRDKALQAIHAGHQGETKSILLTKESVFWPGVTTEVKEMVKGCDLCQKYQAAQEKLPLMQPDLATRPWEKLGTDIYELNGRHYLLVVDYYSKFPITRLLNDITAATVCDHFSSIFSEHGRPDTILADFGSQYISEKFRTKCKNSNITLLFSSPYHHQANSLAERTVRTMKSLLKKAIEDKQCPYEAVWMFRTTPIDDHTPSPYERLYNRKPDTLIPRSKGTLRSHHPDEEIHKENDIRKQKQQESYYNKDAGSDKRILGNHEPVYVLNTLKKIWEPGSIMDRPNPIREPRTYLVDVRGRIYRRTREHLRPRFIRVPDTTQGAPLLFKPTTPPSNIAITLPNTPTLAPNNEERSVNQPKPVPLNIPPPSPAKQAMVTKSVVRERNPGFELKTQMTRTGRETSIPLKYQS